MKTHIHFRSCLAHFFLKWKIFQTNVVQDLEKNFYFQRLFFENRVVYEIMWKNFLEWESPQLTWFMRIGCWIPKAKNTHSHYIMLIAFPLQQWLHERASLLSYTYIVCLAVCKVKDWKIMRSCNDNYVN